MSSPLFCDEAETLLAPVSCRLVAAISPWQNLGDFDGQVAEDDWTLKIEDTTMNRWGDMSA